MVEFTLFIFITENRKPLTGQQDPSKDNAFFNKRKYYRIWVINSKSKYLFDDFSDIPSSLKATTGKASF